MAFILIVDTNPMHASRVSDALISAGHTCGWVRSADQAITLLRWRMPDLILLDETIPGADGGTVPRRLRRAAANVLPIILLTTDSTHIPTDETVLDEIRKPFDPGFLVWRVGHALGTRLQVSASADPQKPTADWDEATPKLRSLA